MDFTQYQLGRKSDTHDQRDLFKAAAPAVALPSHASVGWMPPIKDQGRTNACTGFAAMFFWEQVLHSRRIRVDVPFSPFYPWYFARRYEGSEQRNEGNTLRSIMKALHEFGACPVEYDLDRPINSEPSDIAQTFGRALTLSEYERCNTLHAVKYPIAEERQSAVIGVYVREAWYSDKAIKTGVIPWDGTGLIQGGHAMAIVAYDDASELIQCANSWSVDYGDRGYTYLPYDMLRNEAWDCWTAGYEAIPNAGVNT